MAGKQGDQAYAYCNWSLGMKFDNQKFIEYSCPETIQPHFESEWNHPDFQESLETLFTLNYSSTYYSERKLSLFLKELPSKRIMRQLHLTDVNEVNL